MMLRWNGIVFGFWISGLCLMASHAAAEQPGSEQLVPQITTEWWPICNSPELGELTGSNQQPVDFAVWQAADGTWQLWSCIRRTRAAGRGRLFYRWEGDSPTTPHWKPMGVAMMSDPSLGEDEGSLQAPHVIQEDGVYHMFYGDWEQICHAVSQDGKHFERVIQPSGKTGMFSEGKGTNTRDIMMLKVGETWHGYYSAFPSRQCAVYVRTTQDFDQWSESTTVAFGGVAGTGLYAAECPHVIARHDQYYLFRTQRYGHNQITSVYGSRSPTNFGINQDQQYLITRLPIAAPEIVRHEGEDYLFALNPNLDGIRATKLQWGTQPMIGPPVFLLDDTTVRGRWKLLSGNLSTVFTNSKRLQFESPFYYFVGTAEIDGEQYNDDATGEILSPPFQVDQPQYLAYLSGGIDAEKLYVSIIDAGSGEELLRMSSLRKNNELTPQLIDTSRFLGRQVQLKVVDSARGAWGHINFGGIFETK